MRKRLRIAVRKAWIQPNTQLASPKIGATMRAPRRIKAKPQVKQKIKKPTMENHHQPKAKLRKIPNRYLLFPHAFFQAMISVQSLLKSWKRFPKNSRNNRKASPNKMPPAKGPSICPKRRRNGSPAAAKKETRKRLRMIVIPAALVTRYISFTARSEGSGWSRTPHLWQYVALSLTCWRHFGHTMSSFTLPLYFTRSFTKRATL